MKNEDYQRLVEIARLYYEKDYTQAEIAKAVGVSRPVVSRLLSEAQQRGIVRIEVRSPLDEDHELLGELMRTFGIRGGLIVPTGPSEEAVDRGLLVLGGALRAAAPCPRSAASESAGGRRSGTSSPRWRTRTSRPGPGGASAR